MPVTNDFTANAATQNVITPRRPLRLIGVFQNTTNDYVLLQNRYGNIVRLSTVIAVDDLRLINIGDGSALIAEGDTLHRLIIG